MDGYAKHFYQRNLNANKSIMGNVTDRINLRKKLNCNSFKWYLENVFPEQFLPDNAIATGEVRASLKGGGTL